jgi:[acyl-carrier-protein] S-malonyltransferase
MHARTHSTLATIETTDHGRIRGPDRTRRRARIRRESSPQRQSPRSMSSFAFVFPGQGSQSVGMGRALADASPAARAVFAAADEALGEPISNLAFEGPEDQLNRTENAQPALLATSIAYLAAAHERASREALTLPNPRFYAGHSMGQYSAMVASSALNLPDGVRLVRERGRLMQASGAGRDGAMAAVLGLDDAQLPELVRRASEHGVFAVANRNSPGQVVVSGERAAIEAAAEIAKELGAKRALVLPVSVAAHSPLMSEAAEGMRAVLAEVDFREPTGALLANADARAILDGDGARAELVEHLTAGVDWVGAIERMTEDGVDTFVEVGPGKVLTNLIKRIAPDATAIALDDVLAGEGIDLPFLVPTGPGVLDQPSRAPTHT